MFIIPLLKGKKLFKSINKKCKNLNKFIIGIIPIASENKLFIFY